MLCVSLEKKISKHKQATSRFVVSTTLIHHRLQVLTYIDFLQIFQLESFPVLVPYILALRQTIEVEDQMHELFIGLIVVERNDRNTIV